MAEATTTASVPVESCVTCGGPLTRCVVTRVAYPPDWKWVDSGFIWQHAEPENVTAAHFPKSKSDAPHAGPQALPDLHPMPARVVEEKVDD